LHRLTFVPDANLLAGVGDDAAVYRLREDLAIVVSVDYFTPIVKEAYLYGQIAAANALSDIYVMGAKPIIALNIVCFPAASMDLLTLEEVLRGSSDKLKEAGVLLVGGHTVIDPKEIKYGLSVTGTVDPKRMLTKGGLKVGDRLILTKALGTGIINNALKGGMLDAETEMKVAQSMATLNKRASEVAQEAGVHACTDVTGFGLAGHLLEMIRESKDVGIEVHFSSLPLFPRVEKFAEAGLIPPGSQRNRKFYQEKVSFSEDIPEWKRWIIFDAQTSGGLIFSIPDEETDRLLGRLHTEGVKEAAVIGHVVGEPKGEIMVS
jgi:selenide, water dikinase